MDEVCVFGRFFGSCISTILHLSRPPNRFLAKTEQLKRLSGFSPQGQNLALTVLYGSTVLNLRTTTSQKCEAVPRRARVFKAHRLVYHSTLGSRAIKN